MKTGPFPGAVIVAAIAVGILASCATTGAASGKSLDERALSSAARDDASGFEAALSEGYDVDKAHSRYNDSTALHIAVEYGSARVVRLIAERGGDLDSLNGGFFTAIEIAVSLGDYELADLLLELGADIDRDKGFGHTPLMWATIYGKVSEAAYYIGRGANMYAYDYNGTTGLHLYVTKLHEEGQRCDKKLFVAYLEGGFDPNVPDPMMYRLQHIVCMQNDIAIVKLLTAYDIDWNAPTSEGIPALWFAGILGNYGVLSYLPALGADLDFVGPEGMTLLIWAARTGDSRLAEKLLALGADRSVRDAHGKLAADYAAGPLAEKLAP
jgi:ankyrin repeat protein